MGFVRVRRAAEPVTFRLISRETKQLHLTDCFFTLAQFSLTILVFLMYFRNMYLPLVLALFILSQIYFLSGSLSSWARVVCCVFSVAGAGMRGVMAHVSADLTALM